MMDYPNAPSEESVRIRRLLRMEHVLWNRGDRAVAGVDEAGRGPLAGPVVAAAVCFDPSVMIDGVDDSKRISPTKREHLFRIIQDEALAWGIGIVSEHEIDEHNILRGAQKAMRIAVGALQIVPDHLLVDGRPLPGIRISQTSIVRGDRKSFSIASASILAKVARDRMMVIYDRLYPHYGFAAHKGYGTKAHIEAVRRHGPCAIHRKTFHIRVGEYEGPIGQIQASSWTCR